MLLGIIFHNCSLNNFCKFIFKKNTEIEWNLGNSKANFSKLPDFSKTTDGPDFFHYNILHLYH